MSGDGSRFGVLLVALCAAAALAPSNAIGARPVGATFTPTTGCGGGPGGAVTVVQTTSSPPGLYEAPTAGVITSWNFQAAASVNPIKLKILRPRGGDVFTVIGESALQTPTPNQLNTFAAVRIPVEAGDTLGMFAGSPVAPCVRADGAFQLLQLTGDSPPGSTGTWGPSGAFQLDVLALLEPDCDSDGFGDESQDAVVDCAAPETQITKGPKDKTKKKQATFEFSSNEPGSTFQCSVDGQAPKAFAACTSPLTVKVKKGKHSFEVQATDAAGNVDASAATDDWKVKKKK